MVMDFVGDQDRARSRTMVLILLFAVAIFGIASLIYVIAAAVVVFTSANGEDPIGWWQPEVLLISFGATVLVVGIGSLVKTAQLSSGGKVVAESLGGTLVHPDSREPDLRKLLNVVEEMAIASGCPVPPVYLIDDASINAFAAGFKIDSAVIGVTTGCIQQLSRDELQGVMAHEFSHIVHGDMKINIRITGLIFGIMAIGFIGWICLRFIGPVLLSSRGGKNNPGPALGLAMMIAGLALMAIGSIGTLVSRLIQAAVSRQREFLADASAVDYTRNPSGIADALRKIGGIPKNDMSQAAASEFEHFFFTPALQTAFATHPPLPIRIARIENRPVSEVQGDQSESGSSSTPASTGGTSGLHSGASIAGVAAVSGLAGSESTGAINWRTRSANQVRDSLARQGNATNDHLAYARTLIASIPTAIRDSAHDLVGARAVSLILLVSEDAKARSIQATLLESELDHPTGTEVNRLHKSVQKLIHDAPEIRLVLVDLVMPALARMEEADARNYLALIQGMIDADGQRDRFEWLFGRLLRGHFSALMDGDKGSVKPNRSLLMLESDVRTVLAMIAWSGSRDPEQAERSFRAAAASAGVGNADFPGRTDCSVAKLDRSLDELQRLRHRDRSKLLEAAVEGICADGHATIEEVELLRALASALSCPMPPVLPG